MAQQSLPFARTLERARKVLEFAVIGGAACLTLYWSAQVALGTPDAYRGEVRGGLFLSLAMLTGSGSSVLTNHYVRIALLVLSAACLAASVHFIATWA